MYVTIANLYMALGQTQLEGAQTSTGGWVFIAAVWTVIAAVRLMKKGGYDGSRL
jgi:hypothetical protein